jgi:signal peptidase II
MKKYFLLFLLVFLVDVITKFLVMTFCPGEVALNKGISWSLLHSSVPFISWFVIILVTTFISFFAFYTVRQAQRGNALWGETLVLAGAISNLLDRLVYGGVVDFIQIGFCGYSWPIFNVADLAIVTGASIMLWKGMWS